MKNRSAGLLFVLSIFAVVAAIGLGMMKKDVVFPFFAKTTINGNDEIITCWQGENDNVYVFLPGYASLAETVIRMNTESKVYIDSVQIVDGMRCNEFKLNIPYDLTYSVRGEANHQKITFLQSGGVSTMHIDTQSGSMEYIHAKKGNKESGKIRLYTAAGVLDYMGELESINGRGNYTWRSHEKKAYSLKLNEEIDLLGMGNAQKWILLANASDPSNMRNKIVYDFAKAVGLKYSPDSQWVDLYVNSEYAGLYLLSERNEIHTERVDISGESGCLVSRELKDKVVSQNVPYVSTAEQQILRIHNLESISEEARRVISDMFQAVENAILSERNIDSQTGKSWMELIDVDSWVRKYLIEEIFANFDANYISQYYYFDADDDKKVVYAGPVWDYDLSMGNVETWAANQTDALYANRLQVNDNDYSPWFHALYGKEEFYSRMVELYETSVLPRMRELLGAKMNEYAEQISQAAAMNQSRWKVEQDFWSEVEYMKDFVNERLEFLSSVWLEERSYCHVQANPGNGGYYAYYAIVPGECLTELPILQGNELHNFVGWYYSDTNKPFDAAMPIYEDTEIYGRWEDSGMKRAGQIIKLIPLTVITLFGICLLASDVRRSRKVYKS